MSGGGSGGPRLYQLLIRLPEKRVITVGRLGRFAFPSGYYVYTGSAVRNIESRIARHLRKDKKMRWHIDYFLRQGEVTEIKRYGGNRTECGLNRSTRRLPGARTVVKGFGSSDCSCASHLCYFQRNPPQELGSTSPRRRALNRTQSIARTDLPGTERFPSASPQKRLRRLSAVERSSRTGRR